jgi:hypothetical protein
VRVLAGHRAYAGTVRIGARDITGLSVAAALDARPARLRGIVARWRKAGYASTGTLGPGPAGRVGPRDHWGGGLPGGRLRPSMPPSGTCRQHDQR